MVLPVPLQMTLLPKRILLNSVEVQWREVLSKVFQGFDLQFNYAIGPYKVDFFVAQLMLVLEYNGYCHHMMKKKKKCENKNIAWFAGAVNAF